MRTDAQLVLVFALDGAWVCHPAFAIAASADVDSGHSGGLTGMTVVTSVVETGLLHRFLHCGGAAASDHFAFLQALLRSHAGIAAA